MNKIRSIYVWPNKNLWKYEANDKITFRNWVYFYGEPIKLEIDRKWSKSKINHYLRILGLIT